MLFAGNNSNLLYLSDLKNELDNTLIDSATVTAVLKDSNGLTVSGPTALDAVSGQPGDYVLTLSNTLNLVENALYDLTVTATANNGFVGTWAVQLRALGRQS